MRILYAYKRWVGAKQFQGEEIESKRSLATKHDK